MGHTIIPLAVLTLIGAGGGGLLGMSLGEGMPHVPEKPRASEIAEAASEKLRSSSERGHGAGAGAHASSEAGRSETAAQQSMQVKELPPIITNLGVPETSWVRLQAAIVYDGAAIPHLELLIPELMSDIVAFLRTVSLASIEGAEGLRGLREDLSERVALRSEGHVHEFIIQALVVQ